TSIGTGNGLIGGTITSTGTIAVDTGVGANKILQLNGFAQIPAVDGSLLTNVNSSYLQTRAVSANAPSGGQVITWNAFSSMWEPQTPTPAITQLTGDVTTPGGGSGVSTITNDAVTSAKINSTGVAVSRLLITDATTGGNVTYASCALG